MRKANQWGIPDVDALLDSIDSDQWSEWLAFEKTHVSEARELNALSCATLANCHRDTKKKPQPFEVSDFLPRQPIKQQSPGEIRARLALATPTVTQEGN